jgi:hypothetical protein
MAAHKIKALLQQTPNDLNDTATSEGLINIPGHGYILGYGDTVPADAATGWGTGCIFIHTDGTTLDNTIYTNIGSTTSANFDAQVNS